MMSFLRSQSQTVLVIILIVIGASFIFYGNVGNLLTGSGGRGNDFGRIAGQDLSVAELYDAVRTTRNGLIMSGHAEQLRQPGGRSAVAREAWRQLLLLHEADVLHVQISDEELIDYIHRQPIFQKDGVYNPELYQKQMSLLNDSFHITPDAFETVLRNSLRADTVSKVLFSTIRGSAQDVSAQYQKFQGMVQASLITFDPKTMAASIPVTPDEVQAEYKAHPDNPAYRTAEKRKVDYVLLPITPEQAKLPAKEKAAAVEALGEKALDFALALQPDPTGTNAHAVAAPDFNAEAARRGLKVATTDFFAADTPPAGLPPSPSFNNAAFALSKDSPISKVVELDNGVAVLHFNDLQPSELKPVEAVRADITNQLQQIKAGQQAQVAAQAAAQTLRARIAAGSDFKAAAAALKLPVEVLPAFSPDKAPPSDTRLQMVAYESTQLGVGEISAPVPMETDNSVALIHIDSRAPADPAGFSDFEKRYRGRQDEQIRNIVYIDWANWMSKQPGTHIPPDLDQYGGVE